MTVNALPATVVGHQLEPKRFVERDILLDISPCIQAPEGKL